MKYIKSYEQHKTDIEEDDYVVAYRPYKDSDVSAPITMEFDDYVIEVGIVIKVFLKARVYFNVYRFCSEKEKRGPIYSVVFPGGRYMRLQKHILFHSKNKEDAEQYAQILKNANNYNL